MVDTMIGTDQYPIRILHIVGGMVQGGVETWLLHILHHIDRERFRMDFLVATSQTCAYDDEVRALGSRIIPCLHPRQPWSFARHFQQILAEVGPYDIVHSHGFYYSGYVLRLAQQAGVPIRIAHSHNDSSPLLDQAGFLRRGYCRLMQHWIKQYMTLGLAGSHKAAVALFGPTWESDPRLHIFRYGIDLSPFEACLDRAAVRAELNIPANAFVIGHVGRFVEVKNHAFLVDIAAEAVKREPNTYLLLVGEGELRSVIEQKVARLGLTDHVIFAGLRSDVPRLMLGAMDVFVLPSFSEGLPITGIETQAAGLPLVLSDVITTEVDEVKPLIRRVSLSQPAWAWAEVVLAIQNNTSTITRADAFAALEKSAFTIKASVRQLEEVYKVCKFGAASISLMDRISCLVTS